MVLPIEIDYLGPAQAKILFGVVVFGSHQYYWQLTRFSYTV